MNWLDAYVALLALLTVGISLWALWSFFLFLLESFRERERSRTWVLREIALVAFGAVSAWATNEWLAGRAFRSLQIEAWASTALGWVIGAVIAIVVVGTIVWEVVRAHNVVQRGR